MKRLHINLAVADLDKSVRFYASLFAGKPSVLKDGYAKWMLDDPHVNFSISTHGSSKGVDHLGIQVETDDELHDVFARLHSAGVPVIEQGETTCCYAQSRKNWIFDPEGVAWETFLTTGDSPVYGGDLDLEASRQSACCTPLKSEEAQASAPCCDDAAKATAQARTGCCP